MDFNEFKWYLKFLKDCWSSLCGDLEIWKLVHICKFEPCNQLEHTSWTQIRVKERYFKFVLSFFYFIECSDSKLVTFNALLRMLNLLRFAASTYE